METSSSLITLITVLILCYLYIKRFYNYWKDRNVVYLEPTLFYGNFKRVLREGAPMIDVISEIYNKVKVQGQKFGGIFALASPIFIPVNLDLVKCILQSDFSYFVNRGVYSNEEKEPLTAHLVSLEDDKWKNLRAKLTPTFTTGKLKMMFQSLVACSTSLKEMLKGAVGSENGVDIKDIVGRFTTDTIGSVGFGLDINSMENPDSEFRKYGLEIFDINTPANRNFFILTFLPKWLTNFVNLRVTNQVLETFYMNLIKDTVAYREKNEIYRKDFLHLLIQLKNFGKVCDDEDTRLKSKNMDNTQGITLNEIAAQCFLFFAAGFETSSSTMTYALLELAQHQDIQDKVRKEIKSVLGKYGNEITYQGIAEMEYLEKTMLETLRMHPPFPTILRICNRKYRVPNSDLILDVGTKVNIPVFAIQRDPDYYPNPDNFDPERFSEEHKADRHPMAYLPFGDGPRNCIASRLGKLQAKVGLCCVLMDYKVTLHHRTQLPIKYEMTFVTSVKGGVWINLEPLSQIAK